MDDYPDTVSVRVFQDPEVSFHPKAYLFYSADGQAEAAFVGSSNLSKSALGGGIEWNLLVGSIDELKERFLVLWLDGRSHAADRRAHRRIRTRACLRAPGRRGHRASRGATGAATHSARKR